MELTKDICAISDFGGRDVVFGVGAGMSKLPDLGAHDFPSVARRMARFGGDLGV